MGLFESRPQKNQRTAVPVWYMRQAGRYHSHYQNIKAKSDFMSMCKTPELACEITMGPIDDFKFDAAILFSDLLFPLEQLNLGLSYKDGPPKLGLLLKSHAEFSQVRAIESAENFYLFQKKALQLLKERLPLDKTLLGFVGAPFTLYSYALQGSHSGDLTPAKLGLYDGRFEKFMDLLLPQLIENMCIQAEGGADALCLFDTAVGELTFDDFTRFSLPYLKKVTKAFKQRYPQKKVVYYSKLTHLNYLQAIEDDNIDVLGVDWRMDLAMALKTLGKDYYIQGNIDPSHLHLPWKQLEGNLEKKWRDISDGAAPINKWICGLGHGVLQFTPEENVRKSVQYIHDHYLY